MALKDDVEAGLVALSQGAPTRLSLDSEDACEIPVRIPASVLKLAGGALVIRLKLSRSGRFFTLLAPIAMSDRELPDVVLQTLLADQMFVDRVGGASFARSTETGVIFASYHW